VCLSGKEGKKLACQERKQKIILWWKMVIISATVSLNAPVKIRAQL